MREQALAHGPRHVARLEVGDDGVAREAGEDAVDLRVEEAEPAPQDLPRRARAARGIDRAREAEEPRGAALGEEAVEGLVEARAEITLVAHARREGLGEADHEPRQLRRVDVRAAVSAREAVVGGELRERSLGQGGARPRGGPDHEAEITRRLGGGERGVEGLVEVIEVGAARQAALGGAIEADRGDRGVAEARSGRDEPLPLHAEDAEARGRVDHLRQALERDVAEPPGVLVEAVEVGVHRRVGCARRGRGRGAGLGARPAEAGLARGADLVEERPTTRSCATAPSSRSRASRAPRRGWRASRPPARRGSPSSRSRSARS